jgi:hypothetical protein
MAPIILTSDPPDLGNIGPAIAVCAKGHRAPAGIEEFSVQQLLADPSIMNRSPLTLVVCGLSTLVTPANRVKLDPIWGWRRPGLRRISIDRLLFVGDPWRIWWHFSAVGQERWGFTDSFLAETRWKAAIEQQTEDPFSVDSVIEKCLGVVSCVSPFRFDHIPIRTISLSGEKHDEYAALKERLFRDVGSIAGIIKGLSGFAQAAAPERVMPTATRLFASPPPEIVRTDLPVDNFLSEQLLARIRLTNAIASLRAE